MLEVINEPERECDIEGADRSRIQIINREASEFEIQAENLPDKERLPDMLSLAINAEDPVRSAAFRFDAIKTAVAADIQQAFPREICWETPLNDLPGFTRMIGGLAHYALGLGENSVSEIDPVKPRLEDF